MTTLAAGAQNRLDIADMRESFLSFSPPYLGDEEIAEVVAALRSGWISRGPRTAEFERAFARRVSAPAALGLNSCTAGLHLALRVLGIGPGDEVIAPTMTFCASVNVIEHVGARPILVDVEPETLNIDPRAAEAAVTERTRAIIVVHYGGHPAEMDELRALAANHGLALIEDAAHAIPAKYKGATIGASENLTAFSFYATKNLTTGEGGMLTGAPALVDRARVLGLHGMSGNAWNRYSEKGKWYYEVVEPGYKYNMTDVQAALGLKQLEKLDAMQVRRREVVKAYFERLRDLPAIGLPCERGHVESAWHLFPIRIRESESPVGRAAFIEAMGERNIGTSVHFIPVHLHPFYAEKYGYQRGSFPIAEEAYDELVSLPLHPGLSDDDVADVVEAVRNICCSR